MRGTPTERIAARTQPAGDCLLWTGNRNSKGYGTIWVDGRMVLVHRVAYELEHGPIPDGLTIDHLCEVSVCVRPDHMEPVTRGENTRRRYDRTAHLPWCIRYGIHAPGGEAA